MYFLGDGLAFCGGQLREAFARAVFASGPLSVPRASAVAAEAFAALEAETASDGAAFTPIYVRPSQAEANRALKRERDKKAMDV